MKEKKELAERRRAKSGPRCPCLVPDSTSSAPARCHDCCEAERGAEDWDRDEPDQDAITRCGKVREPGGLEVDCLRERLTDSRANRPYHKVQVRGYSGGHEAASSTPHPKRVARSREWIRRYVRHGATKAGEAIRRYVRHGAMEAGEAIRRYVRHGATKAGEAIRRYVLHGATEAVFLGCGARDNPRRNGVGLLGWVASSAAGGAAIS
jgi:hypothetical protein